MGISHEPVFNGYGFFVLLAWLLHVHAGSLAVELSTMMALLNFPWK